MIKYVLFLILISMWAISFYTHFLQAMSSTMMIAFKGTGHVRDFQHQYQTHGADLWVFGHLKRKGAHLHYGQNPFLTFRRSKYTRMLLVEHAVPVPYQTNLRSVVEYKSGNTTLASLWPRLQVWPPSREKKPLQWFRDHGGHVVTVII